MYALPVGMLVKWLFAICFCLSYVVGVCGVWCVGVAGCVCCVCSVWCGLVGREGDGGALRYGRKTTDPLAISTTSPSLLGWASVSEKSAEVVAPEK